MPAQPQSKELLTPSPTWPRSSPTDTVPPTLRTPNIAGPLTTITTEEVSTVQPVSLRQGRGARLSFLGGRKKENTPPQSSSTNGEMPHAQTNGTGVERRSKDNPNRRSFFRPDKPQTNGDGHGPPQSVASSDWLTDAGPGESIDTSMLEKEIAITTSTPPGSQQTDVGPGGVAVALGKTGSVRKRLSLLRLGKKTSRTNGLSMGAVDEE